MSDGMPQEEIVITLRKELTAGSGADAKVIKELRIHEPSAGQLAAAEQFAKKGGTEQIIQLLALVTGVHFTILKNLSGSDFKKASEAIGSFFEDGQETGANSSQN